MHSMTIMLSSVSGLRACVCSALIRLVVTNFSIYSYWSISIEFLFEIKCQTEEHNSNHKNEFHQINS